MPNFIAADTPIRGFRSFVGSKGFNLRKVRHMTPSCFFVLIQWTRKPIVSAMPDSEDWCISSHCVSSLWMSCHRFAATIFKELSICQDRNFWFLWVDVEFGK